MNPVQFIRHVAEMIIDSTCLLQCRFLLNQKSRFFKIVLMTSLFLKLIVVKVMLVFERRKESGVH